MVEHISDRVAVMYLGAWRRSPTGEAIYRDPRHPYTQALMSAIPIPDPTVRRQRIILTGDVPSPLNPPRAATSTPAAGCGRGSTTQPSAAPRSPLRDLETGHRVACHFAERSRETLDRVQQADIVAWTDPPAPCKSRVRDVQSVPVSW